MALRLILIRHGLSTFNLEKRIQGRNDLSVLSAEGKQQALETGKALSELTIDALYSSPLKRAASTAQEILTGLNSKLKVVYEDGLLEVDLGLWSGLTTEELKERFPDEYKTWQINPNNLEIEDKKGDKYKPIKKLKIQARDFIDRLLKEHSIESDKTIAIVAHNAILRCLILSLIGDPHQGFRRIKLDNASLSIINLIKKNNNLLNCQIECLNNTTHLIKNLPKKGKSSRIILVRHGETDWNLQGRFQGQIDIPLNKNGKSQAEAAREFLKDEKIDKTFSSNLSRPLETAKIIIRSHPNQIVNEIKDLIEIGHGLWEGKLESEINETWPKLLKDWKEKPDTVEMPKGETIQKVWNRSLNSWEEICNSLKDDETALVVAHDAVNKTILCHLLGLSPSDIWMVKQGNGGITVIDISKDRFSPDVITCLNLTSHLGNILDCTAGGAL